MPNRSRTVKSEDLGARYLAGYALCGAWLVFIDLMQGFEPGFFRSIFLFLFWGFGLFSSETRWVTFLALLVICCAAFLIELGSVVRKGVADEMLAEDGALGKAQRAVIARQQKMAELTADSVRLASQIRLLERQCSELSPEAEPSLLHFRQTGPTNPGSLDDIYE
jgi:hypothetical protein